MNAQRRIVLASTSPRRRELLGLLGVDFTVMAPDYEEDMTLDLPPAELASLLASGKVQSLRAGNPNTIIVGADTFIEHHGRVLGKPTSPQHAVEMLHSLSGSTHHVVTGYAVLDTMSEETLSSAVTSTIHFADLDDDEVRRYVASGEPLDKAGSYAVNGLGAMFVEHIDGDHSAIVGLPLRPVARSLRHFGIAIPR